MSEWIPCKERMPKERDSIFKKLYGTKHWKSAMFLGMSDDVNVTVEFEDGKRKTITMHTVDGEWKFPNKIIKMKPVAWMPLPEPYEGD